MDAALERAVRRGVRILNCGGRAHGTAQWALRETLDDEDNSSGVVVWAPPGFHVTVHRPSPRSVLVADGRRGLVIDHVELWYQGIPVTMEVAGELLPEIVRLRRAELIEALGDVLRRPAPTRTRRVELLPLILFGEEDDRDDDAPTSLSGLDKILKDVFDHPDFRSQVAQVAFRRQTDDAGELIRHGLAAASDPRDQARIAHAIAVLGRRVAPDVPDLAWDEPCTRAWKEAMRALRAGTSDLPVKDLSILAQVHPPSQQAAPFVEAVLQTWLLPRYTATQRLQILETVERITDAAFQPNASRTCPAWRQARDIALFIEDLSPETIRALAEWARRMMNAAEGRQWAAEILARIPRASTVYGLTLWLDRALPLRDLAGRHLEERAVEVWRGLLAVRPEALDVAIPAGAQVMRAEILITMLLEGRSSAAEVVQLHNLFAKHRPREANGPAWTEPLRLALRVLEDAYTEAEHGPIFEELARSCAAWTEGQRLLADTAGRIVARMEPPLGPEGLPWWLGEAGGLRTVLGAQWEARALAAVRPHLPALREARKRNHPVWPEVRTAWVDVGLPVLRIDDLATLDEPKVGKPATSPSTQKPKSKGKKKR